MNKLTYDLHIHSCLSPCGDNDNTPANIVGMAALKGLDVIAVTDHNSCRNCESVEKMGEAYGVRTIPGMELCTEEEVHVVCLFPDLYAAMDFDRYVYSKMTKIKNKTHIFGEQLIYNADDQIIGSEDYLLLLNTSIRFDDLFDLVEERAGIMIPAHVEKEANSLLSNLGFVPPESRFTCAEFKDLSKYEAVAAQHPYFKTCTILSNSDAHYLCDIHEPEFTLIAKSASPHDVIQALKKGL